MSQSFWDDRYAEPELAYGDQPNDWLREAVAPLQPGRALCLAEGQGRNAVWLAERGWNVLAVDLSAVGLERAAALAREHGVVIETLVADLSTWEPEPASVDLVVAIFAHLPPVGRAHMHAAAVRALRPGGTFVVEAYSPRQLAFGTGGPRDAALLVEPEILRAELDGIELDRLEEIERVVREGQYHDGPSAVVRCSGRRY